jgi:hypothetical protein
MMLNHQKPLIVHTNDSTSNAKSELFCIYDFLKSIKN